jgi:hypothetical protein
MSVAVAEASGLEGAGKLRYKFGSLDTGKQDTGWLSVSSLGAVSAESCGRDSFLRNLLDSAS